MTSIGSPGERRGERGPRRPKLAVEKKIGRDALVEPAPALERRRRACAARLVVASLSGAFAGSATSVATRADDMTAPGRGAENHE